MPGPPPKDASLRARRNKSSTAATLAAVPADTTAPELPERHDDEGNVLAWHPMALDFWAEVWASPMRSEYLDADVPGLFILVALTDAYWRGLEQGRAGKELAAEIRLQRIDYGLTPIARRRLQWEVEKAEDAVDKGRKRRVGNGASPEQKGQKRDPRLALAQG